MSRQYEKRRATFTPEHTDDLRPEMVALIGKSATFEAMYVLDEGSYEGQMAWMSREPGWFWWVPECDLTFEGDE